mmetsp:Transcript_113288/g.320635  ORF Transcript_113288/g.320635 Transcript_113288/m.320635 type:complete len:248 (+) Transcript_113288:498-1241(+)
MRCWRVLLLRLTLGDFVVKVVCHILVPCCLVFILGLEPVVSVFNKRVLVKHHRKQHLHAFDQCFPIAAGNKRVETMILKPTFGGSRRRSLARSWSRRLSPSADQQGTRTAQQVFIANRRGKLLVLAGQFRDDAHAPQKCRLGRADVPMVEAVGSIECRSRDLLQEGRLGPLQDRVQLQFEVHQLRNLVTAPSWPPEVPEEPQKPPSAPQRTDKAEETTETSPWHQRWCAHHNLKQEGVVFEHGVLHV